MSSGAQIFLVSACSSGEDFVGAFRRYVDRNGVVFVPIAEPLPAGRRGRIALTLSDGGVMIEGQAEVVSSARTPSVLHGRVGMTVKFVAPDEPSKTVLAELEKARLALKPSAPSVAPRAADVPSSPRPVPPPAGGRIDSVNALAECVVCGDAAALSRDSDVVGMPVAVPASPGSGRVAKPSVPPPIPRPPGHTTPPFRAKPPSIPPPVPATSGTVGKSTTLGLPALDRKPAAPVDLTVTMRGPAPGVTIPADDKVDVAQTLRGTMPPHLIAAIEKAKAAKAAATPQPLIADGEDEKTDLSDIPALSAPLDIPPPPPVIEDVEDGTRDTAAMPAMTEPVDPLGATAALTPIKDNAGITPVIEEASGDWTMTPGGAPMPVPREKDVPKGSPTGDWSIVLDPSRTDGWSEPSKIEKRADGEPPGPPVSAVAGETSIDPTSRALEDKPVDEGSKIEIDASLHDVPVSSMETRPSSAMALPPPPAMGMPAEAISYGSNVSPVATFPGVGPVTLPPMAGYGSEPVARLDPTDLRSGFFRESGDIQNLSGMHASHDAQAAKKRRNIIVGAAVGGALLFVIVLAVVLSGGSESKPSPAPTPTVSPTAPPAPAAVTPPTAPTQPAVAPDAAVQDIPPPTDHQLVDEDPTPPPPETPPPVKVDCPIKITSVPSDAQVFRGSEALGTTPLQITLPCGSKQEVVLKKAKYATTTRKFTVKDNGKPVKLTLDKILFGVKVMSTPSRATVTVNGKNLGITPATVRIPAFEASTIKIELAGYAPETQKVTPKENNKISVSVLLKKSVKPPAPKKR